VTPPVALVDRTLERLLVAALIQDPSRHPACGDLGVQDFGDPHAARGYQAVANVLADGTPVTLDSLSAWLQADYASHGPHRAGEEILRPRDLQWLVDLASLSVPPEPAIALWSAQLLVLAETRRGAVADAEPVPRRAPRGPRAQNTEPVRLAEAFRSYAYQLDGEPTLVRWARAWWRYDGIRYVEHDDELLDRDIIGFLDVVVAPQSKKDPVTGMLSTSLCRVTSRNKTLSEVRKSLTFAMPVVSGGAPQWTSTEEGDRPPEHIVAVANGLLDVDRCELQPATPRFFTTTAVGTAWNPESTCPQWLAFLSSIWGEDRESIRALKQVFGYLLTADTSYQKMFMLYGPPRCGKGTIARVLKRLLGDAVVNPTLKSLEQDFGLAPLVGKTVAIIGDARLGGAADQATIVERLLSISGEDALSVNRKNRDAINVQLKTRVLLLSNELPRLYDTSGALASRFVLLCLTRSFLGQEDLQLDSKLAEELPGILRWAVEGLADLAEAGRFTVPASSAEAMSHLLEVSSPHSVFLEECLEVSDDGDAYADVDEVYAAYKTWCDASGRDPENKQLFGKQLHTLCPRIEIQQYRKPPMGKRTRRYVGLRLAVTR
jgi:putative DNA primase/helicase